MRLPVPGVVRRALVPQGSPAEDAWGFDPGFARGADPLVGLVAGAWWRLTATGTGDVPPSGPVLLVANSCAPPGLDALLVAHVLREVRRPRFLVPDWALELPWASIALRKLGGVAASPHNALRLLAEGEAVLAFPETPDAEPGPSRYHVRRFGRGGVVELALRAQVPVVPVGIVGGEEAWPVLGQLPGLARLLRLPSAPLTTPVPLPARWRIAFGDPIAPAGGPEAADDRALVLARSDDLRDRVQELVWQQLIEREGAFR